MRFNLMHSYERRTVACAMVQDTAIVSFVLMVRQTEKAH